MKVGILLQYDNNSVMSWQHHVDLYYKDKEKAQDLKRILESQNISTVVWGSFLQFYDEYLRKGLSVDLVLNGIENCFGADNNGYVTSFLEMHEIPYVGNSSFVNSISSDKALMQDIAEHLGISTPKYIEITNENIDQLPELMLKKKICVPCVLKYRWGTMSYETKKINIQSELYKNIVSMLNQNSGSVLCEEYIEGREITVPIIGSGLNTNILSVIEYTDEERIPLAFYDTQWKEEYDPFVQLCPLNDSLSYVKDIKSKSLKLYHYLGFRDLARLDYRLSIDQTPYFLEANSIPNISSDSAFDPCSYGFPCSFSEILKTLILGAYKRYQ